MTKVNTKRGERKLTVGGVDYVLTPSFKNLVALEDAVGMGLVDFTHQVAYKKARIGCVCPALAALMDVDVPEQFYENALAEHHVYGLYAVLADVLLEAMVQGSDGGTKKA